MSKEMLINNVEGLECRIAIVENGVLEELYVERASSQSHVGNVYKGRVLNVEASIQAAFVDFGLPKNGFLHISDVHPQHFPKNRGWAASEPVGHKCPHRERPPIQECLRRGQEVVVQVTKEGIGTKGPTLTTYVSIPGRMLVIMPGMNKLGISRKIETDEGRAQARTAMAELTFPPEYGFILRTAGLGRNKRDLQRDLNYLVRLWKTVDERIRTAVTPCEIYRESDLVIRTIRDVYGTDIDRVVCDDPEVARKVSEFIAVAMPRSKHVVEQYTGRDGLFHDAGLEDEIEKIYARKVELPGGGYLVVDQTEALVAIDVNSGRYREHSDAETTASKINLAAAREIGRQLRLRDLGGMILIDFIDMREARNCRAVEKTLRTALVNDRAKSKILKMSAFGIVEMTRQRLGPSLRHSVYCVCSHCDGMGLIKSPESQALQALRILRRAIANEDVIRVEVTVTIPVEHELANRHRAALAALEAAAGKRILLTASDDLKGEEIRINCLNTRGTEVAWELRRKWRGNSLNTARPGRR
ncbi:MAG: Rne/Rng family ribonuclease [Planctomycetota bacterium]|nr:Rne/Rng family ribonuclease [Planctomycetota bacterium]